MQFTKLQKNVANYLQRLSVAEGYLVAEMVQMGQKQVIELPAPVDAKAPDRDNLNLIRNEEIKSVVKRCQKLDKSLKKGFATVYDQCSREAKQKLATTDQTRLQIIFLVICLASAVTLPLT